MFAFKASATASFRVTTKEDTQKTSEKFDSQQPGFKEIQQMGQHQVYKLVILMTHTHTYDQDSALHWIHWINIALQVVDGSAWISVHRTRAISNICIVLLKSEG